MKKILITPNENRCIGCGLCVIKSSLLLGNTIDFSKAFIKIVGKPGKYKIIIDYGIKVDSLEEIVNICPKKCFEIKEIPENEE